MLIFIIVSTLTILLDLLWACTFNLTALICLITLFLTTCILLFFIVQLFEVALIKIYFRHRKKTSLWDGIIFTLIYAYSGTSSSSNLKIYFFFLLIFCWPDLIIFIFSTNCESRLWRIWAFEDIRIIRNFIEVWYHTLLVFTLLLHIFHVFHRYLISVNV